MAIVRVVGPSATTSRHLRGAAVDDVADPALVDLDRTDRLGWPRDLVEELIQCVLLASQRRRLDAQRLEDAGEIAAGDREAGLEHRLPALETGRIDLAQALDVHQARPGP